LILAKPCSSDQASREEKTCEPHSQHVVPE
jgi:hypothetical protein